MRTIDTLATALVAALLLGAGGDAGSGLASLLALEAPVSAEAPGLVRLPLPPEVVRECRPDLSDLRVFDAAGREIPFLVDSLRLDEAVEVTESFEPEVRGVRRDVSTPERDPGFTTETYEIEPPPHAPQAGTWDLVVEATRPRFVREVTLRQDRDGAEQTLAAGEPLFRLDAATRRVRLPLPPLGSGTLRVEITGQEGFYLEPHFRFESGRRLGAAERSSVTLDEIGRERGEGRTIVELARPSGLVPALLRVETTTGTLRRPVAVFDEQPGSTDVRIGTGTLYRLDGERGGSNLLVYLRPARGATLRVEIEDGDSPPLADLRFQAVIRRPALVFDLPAAPAGTASATLRFGGGRVRRAHYDLDAFAARRTPVTGAQARGMALLYDGSWLPLARLGETRPNPRFDAQPALAFAMHPGATIDPRLFAYRRAVAIAPSPEGLSRLALDPEDSARLRPDLADLRVVDDDGRQWPYLVSADARRESVALVLSETRSERRRSRFELSLPVAPLRVEGVTLRSSAPFFDRGFRLLARDEHGREQVVAQGRLVKQALHPAPVRIGFASRPVHSLQLVVDDGDDAPLAFDSVRADVRLPELFLVAPQGRYALLMGNPDVPAPRYELERVRDIVLAASSNPARTEALEPNPVYSLGARLRGEDGPSGLLQLGLVWGVLLVAVAVLAGLTLRVVRQAPTATEPGDDAREP